MIESEYITDLTTLGEEYIPRELIDTIIISVIGESIEEGICLSISTRYRSVKCTIISGSRMIDLSTRHECTIDTECLSGEYTPESDREKEEDDEISMGDAHRGGEKVQES
jgi:hypothetical protein